MSTLILVFCGLPCLDAAAQSGVFCIGNSLTNDCLVTALPGRIDYHMQAGATLHTMYTNPGAILVGGSTRWDEALAERQYSVLCLQPFVGETLEQIAAAAETWLALQPEATVVIHTNWAARETLSASDDVPTEWADPSVTNVRRSNTFFAALVARLRSDHPGRTIVVTDTHAILHDIHLDCVAETSPFAAYSYLFRDSLHLTYGAADGSNGGAGSDGAGRYLAHNALRRTLGLPYQEQDSQCTATEEVKAYLRAKIEAYHGPQKTSGVFR